MSNLLKSGKKDNSRRKGIPAQKQAERRAEAEARQAAYAKLTVAQKIARLDAGGFTASKQRAKLNKELANAKAN